MLMLVVSLVGDPHAYTNTPSGKLENLGAARSVPERVLGTCRLTMGVSTYERT